MPRFQIFPTNQSFSSAEVIAPDGASALVMIDRLECEEADVFRDGEYCFSARASPSGMWCIFQRECPPSALRPS